MSDQTLPIFDLVASTLERIKVVIETAQDPTGTPPEFTTDVDLNGQPTSWVSGTWDGAYVAGRATALSPQIGTTGAITVTDETFKLLFIRWTRGTDKPVKRVCWLDVS